MAKKKSDSKATGQKVSFGVRRNGKAKKFAGPKDKPVSEYRGQGR
jgi:hypothetical protein